MYPLPQIKKQQVFFFTLILSLVIAIYQIHNLLTTNTNQRKLQGISPVPITSTTLKPGHHGVPQNQIIFKKEKKINEVSKPSSAAISRNGKDYAFKMRLDPEMKEKKIKAMKSKPECANITGETRSLWRTQQLGNVFSADEDFQRMKTALGCGALVMMDEFIATPPWHRLYPSEKEYLQYPPLKYRQDIINETYTTVKLLNTSKTFKVGDRVAFRIDARDSRNRSRSRGGDEIRAWFKTKVTKDITNRVAATVLDLKNGSYIVDALLPWAGKLRLSVALAYPSEHIRAILQFHRLFKGMMMFFAKYESEQANETTPCYHRPVLPGYLPDEVCNLTSVNGSPWFCGRPLKKSLTCEDYINHRTLQLNETFYLGITKAEYKLLERTNYNPRMRMISSDQIINVEPKSGVNNMAPASEKCNSIDPRKTWELGYPTGYVYNGTWQSFLCTGVDLVKTQECLKNKLIITLGDSNARSHLYNLQRVLDCRDVIPHTSNVWHKPLKCVQDSLNTTVTWNPHSQPFMSSKYWSVRKDFLSAAHVLDQALNSNDTRQIWVILHHYVHLGPFHQSVYEAKYVAIKNAVSRLLERRPNARVVIEGPHITWNEWIKNHYTVGDQLGPFILQIQRQVFKDMQDKIYFVNNWDQSIAAENKGIHPWYQKRITQFIFGLFCDK